MNISRFYLAFALLFLFSFGVVAQNTDFRSNLSVNTGLTIIGAGFKALDGENFEDFADATTDSGFSDVQGAFSGKAAPAIQINYDYSVKRWFSIGGGVSYQRLGFDVTDFAYTDDETGDRTSASELNVDANRFNIAVRALFHYGNINKVDMYSGFRVGTTIYGLKVETTDQSIKDDLGTGFILPSVQIIPFALRGYVTENIGISFETAILGPHALALGLNYRF